MTFDSTDAWLLESILLSEEENKGASLRSIIASADYINHAILTFQEFSTAMQKLKSIGVIVEKRKKLFITKQFKKWWIEKYNAKKSFAVLKAMNEIEKYLVKTHGDSEASAKLITKITEADFTTGVEEYLKPS